MAHKIANIRCQNAVRRVSFGIGMNRITLLCAAWLLCATRLFAAVETNTAAKVFPPAPAREFRAAWIATVANIDWPSEPGLSVAQQKAELISLLDRAAQLHFNAVLFQVRTVGDALYDSKLEPWSEYLTGTQGKAPSPAYDPLALAVAEAHQRGLELHAWFNPFRAGHPKAKSPSAPSHAVRKHPELIRHYGTQTWFDPGAPESQTRALNAVLDVVKRYDVDGVVFDDYFYPYPEKGSDGQLMDFPDAASWKKYGAATRLSRNDWRRDNVNRFVQKVSQSVHTAKPWVKFGISPFGIWRPGVPAGIDPKALDAYDKLYADARLWLANGWVDYLAPQLYWPLAQREHGFAELLQWWRQQNTKGRHVFAALNDAAVGSKFSIEEIPHQIQTVRAQAASSGAIHYHLRSVLENSALSSAVKSLYAQPALPPATPWLDATPPPTVKLTVLTDPDSVNVRWNTGAGEPARWWLLQTLNHGNWQTEILPAGQPARRFTGQLPDAVSVRAVDRAGNLSEPASWRK
jgi:uncharacterized lipoprotein YddW (UPF0748 family)